MQKLDYLYIIIPSALLILVIIAGYAMYDDVCYHRTTEGRLMVYGFNGTSHWTDYEHCMRDIMGVPVAPWHGAI